MANIQISIYLKDELLPTYLENKKDLNIKAREAFFDGLKEILQ